MAMSLKELIIKVIAPTDKAVKGLKAVGKAVQTTAKTTVTASKKMAGAFKTIDRGIARTNKFMQQHKRTMRFAGLAIIGTFTAMGRSALKYGVQIDKMMKQTGMSAEALSKMAYAAEQEHASIDVLEKSLVKLARTMQYYIISPSSEYAKAFDMMGIKPVDSAGQLRDASEVFAEIAEWMYKTEDATTRAAMALTLFGRGGGQLLPFLRLGSKALKELYQEAEELGIVLDEKAAKAAKSFDDKLTSLSYALKGVGLTIFETAGPGLGRMIDYLKDLIVKTGAWNKELDGLPAKISVVSAAIAGLSLVALPAIIKSLSTLAAHPVGLLISGIVAAAAGLYVFREKIFGTAKIIIMAIRQALGVYTIAFDSAERIFMALTDMIKRVWRATINELKVQFYLTVNAMIEEANRILAKFKIAPIGFIGGIDADSWLTPLQAIKEGMASVGVAAEKAGGEIYNAYLVANAAVALYAMRLKRAFEEEKKGVAGPEKKAPDDYYRQMTGDIKETQDAAEDLHETEQTAIQDKISWFQMELRIRNDLETAKTLAYGRDITAQEELLRLKREWIKAVEDERKEVELRIQALEVEMQLAEKKAAAPTTTTTGYQRGDAWAQYVKAWEDGGEAVGAMERQGVQAFDSLSSAAGDFARVLIDGSQSASEYWEQFFKRLMGDIAAAIIKAVLLKALLGGAGATTGAGKKDTFGSIFKIGLSVLRMAVGGGAGAAGGAIGWGAGGAAGAGAGAGESAQEGGLVDKTGWVFVHRHEVIAPTEKLGSLVKGGLPSTLPGAAGTGNSGQSIHIGNIDMNAVFDSQPDMESLVEQLSDYIDVEMNKPQGYV